MRLAVLKETRAAETRVAATPDTVKKLIGLGLTVAVETGAGKAASMPDSEYQAAGAEISPDAKATLAGAGIVFAVRAPDPERRGQIPRGALLVCTANAFSDPGLIPSLAEAGIDAAAMELLPRITRAQSMDVLSSQANLAGYRAVIEGAASFQRGFPMMMTAAGTVPPARVFVIGAGVAGLQAIATARRLGGIVSATDVRPAAKEEIRSLGATFVGVEDEETARQTGAYAGQMSDAFRKKQAELMSTTVAKNDIVICTALVMGRQAPVIVTQPMVDSMRPGSVVVDLASDAGGNCAATKPGELVETPNGVKILSYYNWPGRIPVAASSLYSRNLLTFLTTFWDKESKSPKLPDDDDIVKGVMLTRGGRVVHPQFQQAAAASPSGPGSTGSPPTGSSSSSATRTGLGGGADSAVVTVAGQDGAAASDSEAVPPAIAAPAVASPAPPPPPSA